jgi:hypothetical protein
MIGGLVNMVLAIMRLHKRRCSQESGMRQRCCVHAHQHEAQNEEKSRRELFHAEIIAQLRKST